MAGDRKKLRYEQAIRFRHFFDPLKIPLLN
jgi:hypothetical protein